MRLLVVLFFFGTILYGQKAHSIYVKRTNKKFSNHYKNYSERDSLVLYQDFTFKREENFWGFDEINKKVILGKWNFKNKTLFLVSEKVDDSSKVKEIIPFKTSIESKDLKNKYKKVK